MNFFAIFVGIFLPESGMNEIRDKIFFSLLLVLSQPGLAKNNVRKRFFIYFFLFFGYFFQSFLVGVECERNSGLKFFSLFVSLSHPVLVYIILERGFLVFWIFLLFFSKFSSPSWVWTEFGTKIFFSLSRPLSALFG